MAPPPSFTPINASRPQSNPPAATASPASPAIAAESKPLGADTAQTTQATQATQTTRTQTGDSGDPSLKQSNPLAATASLVSLAIAVESMLSGADTAQSTQATQATQTTRTRTPDSGGPSPKPDPVTIHYSELIGKSRVALVGAASLRELEKLPVRTCPMHWQPKVSGWGWDRCANRRKQRKRKLELIPSMKWQRGILRTTIKFTAGNCEAALMHIKGTVVKPPCDCCARGSGPFLGCVVVSPAACGHGECANCHYNHKSTRCNFHNKWRDGPSTDAASPGSPSVPSASRPGSAAPSALPAPATVLPPPIVGVSAHVKRTMARWHRDLAKMLDQAADEEEARL
jgi:hypothetical protein